MTTIEEDIKSYFTIPIDVTVTCIDDLSSEIEFLEKLPDWTSTMLLETYLIKYDI